MVTGRKDTDQILTNLTNNFTIHYPKVSCKKSEDRAYVLLNISTVILFALKQPRKSNMRIFCYICITGDLENLLYDIKVCNEIFFPSVSLKICGTPASDNLKINIICFTIYHGKCRNQEIYFNYTLFILSGDISIKLGLSCNSQIYGLRWSVCLIKTAT